MSCVLYCHIYTPIAETLSFLKAYIDELSLRPAQQPLPWVGRQAKARSRLNNTEVLSDTSALESWLLVHAPRKSTQTSSIEAMTINITITVDGVTTMEGTPTLSTRPGRL